MIQGASMLSLVSVLLMETVIGMLYILDAPAGVSIILTLLFSRASVHTVTLGHGWFLSMTHRQ